MRYSFFELGDVLLRGMCDAGLCIGKARKKSAVRRENAKWDCMLAGVTGLLV